MNEHSKGHRPNPPPVPPPLNTKSDKQQLLTIIQKIQNNGISFTIKCTQRLLSPHYNKGHFLGYIENSNGHVIYACSTSNSPKDRITINNVTDIFVRFMERESKKYSIDSITSRTEEEFEL
jgi:hypothetical protein